MIPLGTKEEHYKSGNSMCKGLGVSPFDVKNLKGSTFPFPCFWWGEGVERKQTRFLFDMSVAE